MVRSSRWRSTPQPTISTITTTNARCSTPSKRSSSRISQASSTASSSYSRPAAPRSSGRCGPPCRPSRDGANPIAIIIPCHRVIASDGTLHGYAGGLERKRMLLDLEAKSLFV